MKFAKKDNIYRIILITGSQNNILDVFFGEDNKMEILDTWMANWRGWENSNFKKRSFRTNNFRFGVGQSLSWNKPNYKLSKIYFLPSDRALDSVYNLLICKLIYIIIMEINSKKSKYRISEMIFGKVTRITSLFQNQ